MLMFPPCTSSFLDTSCPKLQTLHFSIVPHFHPCMPSLVYKYYSCVSRALGLILLYLIPLVSLLGLSMSTLSHAEHACLDSSPLYPTWTPVCLPHHLVSISDFFPSCLEPFRPILDFVLHPVPLVLVSFQSLFWPTCNSWVVDLPARLGSSFCPFGMLRLCSEYVCDSWYVQPTCGLLYSPQRMKVCDKEREGSSAIPHQAEPSSEN